MILSIHSQSRCDVMANTIYGARTSLLRPLPHAMKSKYDTSVSGVSRVGRVCEHVHITMQWPSVFRLVVLSEQGSQLTFS